MLDIISRKVRFALAGDNLGRHTPEPPPLKPPPPLTQVERRAAHLEANAGSKRQPLTRETVFGIMLENGISFGAGYRRARLAHDRHERGFQQRHEPRQGKVTNGAEGSFHIGGKIVGLFGINLVEGRCGECVN